MKNSSTNKIPIYQVDAFTGTPFGGNPAAVCILGRKYEDRVLQCIAAEMNLSETAFVRPCEESNMFLLRWFTPKVEVPLCGHATLATAAVLFYGIGIPAGEINFETKSGKLIAKKDKNGILLNFPRDDPVKIDPPHNLLSAMDITDFKTTVYAQKTKNLLVHLPNEDDVKNLTPGFGRMTTSSTTEKIEGVIVTARGQKYDFISRYFAPWIGIDEDPVTGAAHTVLTPYWSKILGKKEMSAYQASSRGGNLTVRLASNERVELIGRAVIVLKGELYL